MSKDIIPLVTPDISRFARDLARQLGSPAAAPSHLELMNMLARSAGFRNYQHLRAASAARERLASENGTSLPDYRLVERTLNHFDQDGVLLRWPSRRQVQLLCLWCMWARLPAGISMRERQVNALLGDSHAFGDAALLRRELFDLGLVSRNRDGSDYRRKEQRPPAEARDLIRRIRLRRNRATGEQSPQATVI